MTVSPVSNVTSPPASPLTAGSKTLGSADFMKLLAVQFQSQDPLKPMDDTAFIAQMAQFTSLQQSQTLTTEMTKLSTSQELVAANSYIGRQVTVDDGKGGLTTGIVSGVEVDSTGPKIMVGANPYAISAVHSVQPAPLPTSPAAGAGGA